MDTYQKYMRDNYNRVSPKFLLFSCIFMGLAQCAQRGAQEYRNISVRDFDWSGIDAGYIKFTYSTENKNNINKDVCYVIYMYFYVSIF